MRPDGIVGNPDGKEEGSLTLPQRDSPEPDWFPRSACLPGPYAGFRLICPVGHGARASVWMAEAAEEYPGLSLALTFYTREKAFQSPVVAEAFWNHAEELRKVEGPFLVRLRQVLDLRLFHDAGWPPFAVVTQLVEPSLQEVLSDLTGQEQERLPADLVREWASQLFEAVEALHGGYGRVHCNIKPSNILLNLRKGSPYEGVSSLAGASVLLGDLVTACPLGEKVPAWVPANDEWKAPEVRVPCSGERRAHPEEDLYALGLVLRRLSDAAEGDLTRLRDATDLLIDVDTRQRLVGRQVLRTLLFSVSAAALEDSDEPAVILRRSQVFRREQPGQPILPERSERREPCWAEVEGVPGYAVRHEIGRGGIGIVYEARELALNRLVAIKVLRSDLIASRAERFRIEASALARLNHPNIVQVYSWREGDQPYLVMELVTGQSLRKVVEDEGPLPAQEAARIAEMLARALDYVHKRAILHRDLKPSNVMLTRDRTAKLLDFGLAKLQKDDPDITPPGTLLGTPHYLAPELLRGSDRAEARTDLYGVGATLYYMLTGHPPLEANGQYDLLCAIDTTRPVPPSKRNATVPAALEAICLRCLEKQPERRYSTAEVLADALLAFRTGGAETGSPAPHSIHAVPLTDDARDLQVQQGVGGRPDIVWTVAAKLSAARQPTPGGIDRARVDDILVRIFPQATSVIVRAQLLGVRPRPDLFICLVEVCGREEDDDFVVKVGTAQRLRQELDAWSRCAPPGLRRDLVFLPPQLCSDPQGQPLALVFPTVQQFLGVERVVTLEEACLACVRHGIPTTASIETVLAQLFTRIEFLLYRTSALLPPAYPLVLNRGQEADTSFSAPETRQVANTALPVGSDEGFYDPVDACKFLLDAAKDGRTGDCFPELLRGRSHGDLHGRNVLVSLVDSEARWPALFDFADMATDNLVGWDFVKLETELKIRVYPLIFPHRNELDYVRAVKDFERSLVTETDRCQREGNWTQSGGREYAATAAERLSTLLLSLRRQAAICLGTRRGRPLHWLDEYYFLLSWYGVSSGPHENLTLREHLAVFVSAGVASARYLSGRLSRLMSPSATPDRAREDLVREVRAGKFPDFREPLRRVREWRAGGMESWERALPVLYALKSHYPHALQVRHELALVLCKLKKLDKAQIELEAAGREFKILDEDVLSLWARCFKDRGDEKLKKRQIEEAQRLYRLSEEKSRLAYELRHDRFPGINAATLRLLAASLSHQLGQTALARELLDSSRELAQTLLADKENWVLRLSDDNIWVRATEAEAYLLLGRWADAEKFYKAALDQPNLQQFHRDSMSAQAERLVAAYRRLGVEPLGPLSEPEKFFTTPGSDSDTVFGKK